jgi:ribosomal protein S18 acetylase RimI-like enzyme
MRNAITMSEPCVRPLSVGDLTEIERHLLSPDFHDRNTPFCGAAVDAMICLYLRRMDVAHAVLVGALEAWGSRIVGLAEAQPTDRPRVVELAISILPCYRGRGLGLRLLRQVVMIAFARGAEAAEFQFQKENTAISRLVHALGARTSLTRNWAEIGQLCTSP